MSWDADGHHYTQRGNQIYVDNRLAGWITKLANGKRVFISPRDRAKHYFRNYEGWGISRALYTYLLKTVEAQEIHLRIGKYCTLISQIDEWDKHCIPYQKAPFEPQLILPEKYFKKIQLTFAEIMGN